MIVLSFNDKVFANSFAVQNDTFLSTTSPGIVFNKKLVALEGTIEDIEVNKGFPYMKIKLTEDKYVWSVVMIFSIKNNPNKIGDRVRVLGYYKDIDKSDMITKSISKDDYHILTFCMVNLSSEMVYLLPNENNCKDWRDGRVIRE
jgi:hypothetical protein